MSKSKRVIVTEVGENCPYNYLCMPTSPLLAKESDSGKRFCKKNHKECSEKTCPLPTLENFEIEQGLKSGEEWKELIKSIEQKNKQ